MAPLNWGEIGLMDVAHQLVLQDLPQRTILDATTSHEHVVTQPILPGHLGDAARCHEEGVDGAAGHPQAITLAQAGQDVSR